MENRTPHVLELHPASALGKLIGGGAGHAGPAARDAEPDAPARAVAPGRPARLGAALRRRRERAKPAAAPGR